ncbi:MAG TPA: O-antigen ligase family protein [Bryobacteraceae bacterium]
MSKFKPGRRLAPAIRQNRAAPAPEKQEHTSTIVAESSAPPDQVFQDHVLNPTRQFAFKCTLVFLFFRFSFLHEFISGKIHFDAHILLLFAAISYFAAFLAGGLFGAFSERATWMWFGFGACMTLATATSTWRGGSFGDLSSYLRTTLPFVLLIPAVSFTSAEIRKVLNTIGLAGVVTALLGLVSSDFKSGRMAFGSAGSTIQDSNDYAAHMILLLPAIAYLFFGTKRSILFKLAGVPFLALGLYQIFSTGSRGGLVGLIITGLYILRRGTPKIRMAILVAVPVLSLAILVFVPRDASQRLQSLFNSDDETQEALESKEARQALFWASVSITLHHPLLGIGPGEFMDYQSGIAGERGQKGMWHDTHNGYTQISSECGVPALIFYLAALWMTYFSLRRATKAGVPEISTIANILSVMMVAYCVCIVFLSQGYNFNLPVITGITTAINRLLPPTTSQQGSLATSSRAA